MCQSEAMHQITDLISVNNNKVKTNDDITDNKDSIDNNKCVSVTVSVKTVKIKRGKGFTNVLQFDTCDVKNKHITKDNLHIISKF